MSQEARFPPGPYPCALTSARVGLLTWLHAVAKSVRFPCALSVYISISPILRSASFDLYMGRSPRRVTSMSNQLASEITGSLEIFK